MKDKDYKSGDNIETNSNRSYCRTIINSLLPKFLIATFVIFSLLGLVFLFLALRSAGLFGGKGKGKEKDSMW